MWWRIGIMQHHLEPHPIKTENDLGPQDLVPVNIAIQVALHVVKRRPMVRLQNRRAHDWIAIHWQIRTWDYSLRFKPQKARGSGQSCYHVTCESDKFGHVDILSAGSGHEACRLILIFLATLNLLLVLAVVLLVCSVCLVMQWSSSSGTLPVAWTAAAADDRMWAAKPCSDRPEPDSLLSQALAPLTVDQCEMRVAGMVGLWSCGVAVWFNLGLWSISNNNSPLSDDLFFIQ